MRLLVQYSDTIRELLNVDVIGDVRRYEARIFQFRLPLFVALCDRVSNYLQLLAEPDRQTDTPRDNRYEYTALYSKHSCNVVMMPGKI